MFSKPSCFVLFVKPDRRSNKQESLHTTTKKVIVTWFPIAGPAFANSCSQKPSRHKCVRKMKHGHVSTCLLLKNICFPPPKSAPDPPGCFRTSQPMCFTCLQLKNSCFPPPKSAPDPPRWPLGRSGSI